MIAILVNTRIQQRELTLQEYIDILKRSRWKLHEKDNKKRGMATFLETLELARKMGTEMNKHPIMEHQKHSARNKKKMYVNKQTAS
jgi:hypothetical protein